MTTDTTNAQSWRDLADQLTPEQVAAIEGAKHRMDATDLYEIAVEAVKRNRAQERFADVPTPAGVVTMTRWLDTEGTDDGPYIRCFTGLARDINDDTTVRISGEQTSDGTIRRVVEVYTRYGTDGELTAEEARRAAAALIECADELDRLNGA